MNRQEAFDEINKTQDEYIEELISIICNPEYEVMKSINFTSPTGTGKTRMMSKLINSFPAYYFIITTLSRGQLHLQVRNELIKTCNQENFYVYGSADYKINSILEAYDILSRIPSDTRCIWLRDEGHIKTNRFDEILKDNCYKIINFSATNAYSDIKCNFTNTMMLRTVNQCSGTPRDAIEKLIEIKNIHKGINGYNPCAIFRCVGNDTKIYNLIVSLCNEYNLKYIDLNDNTSDVTIAELCKDDNEYDVIINKFKITEGIDIKRSHVLYMDNKPNNNATTIQVIGRCRRNALLYRNDIDIFAEDNKELLVKTRECFVFYNVEKMKIASDENGELQYAFCDHISCEELKPNTTIEVENGQLPNGLYILELEGQSGKYEIGIDRNTGFNVVSPLTSFYDEQIIENSYVYLGNPAFRHVNYKIKKENISKFPIKSTVTRSVLDPDTGEYKLIEEDCEPHYSIREFIDYEKVSYRFSPQTINAFKTLCNEYTPIFTKLIKDNYIKNVIKKYKMPDETYMDKYVSSFRRRLRSKIVLVDDVVGKHADASSSDGMFYNFIKWLNDGASYFYTVNYFKTAIRLISDKSVKTAALYYCILEYEKNPCFDTCKYIADRLAEYFEYAHKSITSQNTVVNGKLNNWTKDDEKVIAVFKPFISIIFNNEEFSNLKLKSFEGHFRHFILGLRIPYYQKVEVNENTIERLFEGWHKKLSNSIFLFSDKSASAKQMMQDMENIMISLDNGIIDRVRYDYSSLLEEVTEIDKLAALNIKTSLYVNKNKLTIPVYKRLLEETNKRIITNDKESAIIGVDKMQLLSDENKWIESKSVTSKVGNYNKFNSYISKRYAKELDQARSQLFNGKNNFAIDNKCNSCLGYCVEYYSKYLLYGENYLGKYIDQAKAEAHVKENSQSVIVRACMLKYKAMMMLAFGSNVSKVIKTISVQKLIQNEYKGFLDLVVELGTRTAAYAKRTLYPDCEPTNLIDPNLSIKHITGLADYITEEVILDVKVKNNIGEKEVRQVLAYHYLSTKRSDLHIKKLIVFDATSNKAVVIDIERENRV